MAEWFGGPIMEKLISTGFEYLKDQVRWQTGMKEGLKRLREYHPKIQAVVFASNQTQIRDQNPALNSWLWQLRDAIDEADDVLDEFEYMKHEKQLIKDKKQTKMHSTMSSMKKGLAKIGKRALHIDPNLKRLEEVVKKLDKVSADVGHFLHLLDGTKHVQQEQLSELYKIRETGSLPTSDLIGRGKDFEFVMQWLRKPSNENQTQITDNNLYASNISLLSIVGIGGMGKTTLLQHVYEDEMTKEFDLKIWVCVSNNFDVKKVIADMLESLKMKRPALESLDALQRCLKSEVMSKKFLLMLDDIWEEDEQQDKSKWENVFSPLACGSLGSKILVTTRMDSTALMIAKVINKKKETLRLQGLEKDDCLQLLNKHAFANVDNPDVHHPKLISISKEIVKKVSGSPLATKVMGGVLNYSLDESHWIKILNSDIGSAEFGQNNVMLILRLSYMVLPTPLQNCFAFCGIFPKDHEFDKDDLVRMWIALGFIQSSHIQGEEVMEDIGERYFDILVKKSLFDEFQNKYRTYYKMHDLLHDLAQSVSAQECFRIDGHEELLFKIPETIRYLSITTRNAEVLRKIWKFKNLRSLFLTYNEDDQDLVDLLARIFKDSRSIRLLNIDATNLKMLPEAIECLIHIRYLKLYHRISHLPRSLSKLYHLQFILSYDYNSISPDFLPRDMNNLSNLHHLELRWDEINGMYGIGKLHSLQRLDGFYVKNEIGYGLGELEHMNDLRQLRIKLLENVKDDMEACSAKLYDKRNLADLSLEWGDVRSYGMGPKGYRLRGNLRDIIFSEYRRNIVENLDEKVLDCLQPHKNLKKLRLHAYMGIKSAIWMDKVPLISNLECIQLDECLEWQILPPFGQLPFLKSLYLNNMPKVKQLGNKSDRNDKYGFFPSIEVLHIKKLEALEDWFDAAAAADDCLFPCLTVLYLKDCPNLQELPSLPPKLKKLKIDNIGWKGLNWKQSASSHCCISKSIPLKTLKVLRCPNIICLPLADELARLATLRKLKIIDCRNLISLSGQQEVESAENCQFVLKKLSVSGPSLLQMAPLRSLTSLQELKIKWNDELLSFPIETEQWILQVSSSLRQLNFKGLKSLQSLPSSLSCLSSLKFLVVEKVPQLQQLPAIPASLENLKLWNLDSLQCLPSSLSISSIKFLSLYDLPLQKLSDLPPSLCILRLKNLKNLDSLPSCLPNLSSLQHLFADRIPQLRELPDFPPSLGVLTIYNCCPELMKRCRRVVGSDWHKIAHIPYVNHD